jgi:hypothetical protein
VEVKARRSGTNRKALRLTLLIQRRPRGSLDRPPRRRLLSRGRCHDGLVTPAGAIEDADPPSRAVLTEADLIALMRHADDNQSDAGLRVEELVDRL